MNIGFLMLAAALNFTPQNTEVVVAPRAWRNQRVAWFAAQEMTNFLSRALGVNVPVRTKLNPAKTSIVLGTNAWSCAAGVDISRLPQDGFVMRTSGSAIYIAGFDENRNPLNGVFPRATLFGAYEFLEKYVGCRFYFPGELGEIVPKRKSFEVPEMNIVSAPVLTERHYSRLLGEWYDPVTAKKRKYVELLGLRLRMHTRPVPCCHGLRFFKYVQRFGKTNPEYFQMKKNGTRDIMDTGKPPLHKNNKFCFSSKGFKEEVYQDVKAYLTGQPPSSRGLEKWSTGNCRYGEYVDIMPEDGTVHCYCPDCQAAYAKAKDPRCESNEQIWDYTIDIAERLKREGVKEYVTQMAYSTYRNVPDRKMPDNIYVTVCNNGGWVRPERAKKDYEQVKAWFGNVGKVKVYSNCGKFACLNLDVPDVPSITPRAMAGFYNRMAPMIRGAYCSNAGERAVYGLLNRYVFSRVAWYGHVDIDALLDEYYRLMFGAAAEPMQEFFEEIERKWMEEMLGASVDTAIGVANMIPSELRIWTELYSPAKLKPLAALFEKAESMVPADSMEAKRIALMKREVVDPMVKRSDEYNRNVSAEGERARRKANPPKSVVKKTGAVTITVDHSMTNSPFKAMKFKADMKQGRKYRISYFVKGENIVAYERRGGAQAVVWFNEKADRAKVVPRVGLEGTFDWIHQTAEVYVPKKLSCDFKPEIDLRMFFATGTAHFDGLVVEEL